MIDPMISELAKIQHQVRLQEAQAARRRPAARVAAPSPIDRLRQAIGERLIMLGQRLQAPSAPTKVFR